MSDSQSTRGGEQSTDHRTIDGQNDLEWSLPTIRERLRVASFWVAIVLPILYLPLLVIGLSNGLRTGVFLVLLGAHLLALYVGHAHNR
ncbi:hypothetical protein [Natronosalvus vescus]|uniref:hypothetical protein n=1 Tax=Natronosalvus vescus TaxID=2953881 RepID=UPI002091A44E|nr:hypothetical protein [Natronosalvus vescus]